MVLNYVDLIINIDKNKAEIDVFKRGYKTKLYSFEIFNYEKYELLCIDKEIKKVEIINSLVFDLDWYFLKCRNWFKLKLQSIKSIYYCGNSSVTILASGCFLD